MTRPGDEHEWFLHDGLRKSAARAPRAIALEADSQTVSYEQFAGRARRLARAFQDAGITRGARIVLHLPNGLSCAEAVYAASFCGGCFVVVHPQMRPDKLHFLLEDSEASVLVTHLRDPVEIASATRSLPSLRLILTETPVAGRQTLEEFAMGASEEPEVRGIPSDLCALIYTSGSTGRPKGVAMTHRAMVFAAQSVSAYLGLQSVDRILNILPVSFDYGLYQLLMSVRVGARLVLERGFIFPVETVTRAAEAEVTVFPGVPTVFASLLRHDTVSPIRLGSVRVVTNTAAALPSEFLDGLRRMFPQARIFAMYGLTECKRVAYLEPEQLAQRPTSVGKAIPGTEAIVLRADGSEADVDEVGLLHVRGPHVMSGYWRRPDQTAEMLRAGPVPGEWMLCTQDLFRRDSEGYLYFVGRTDDIIKSGGEKVSPVEVEEVLHAIEGVRQAVVVGVPDALLGEAVHAVVTIDADALLTAEEIRRETRRHLEGFLVPAAVTIVERLPVSENGKVSRAAARLLVISPDSVDEIASGAADPATEVPDGSAAE